MNNEQKRFRRTRDMSNEPPNASTAQALAVLYATYGTEKWVRATQVSSGAFHALLVRGLIAIEGTRTFAATTWVTDKGREFLSGR